MENISIVQVNIEELKPSTYNPRKWNQSQIDALKESIQQFGMVDPLLCNNAKGRENIVIGGHFRLKVAKELGHKTVPVVYISIADIEKEKELNIRLNKNLGEWDFALLKEFDEEFLKNTGFSTEELDEIFNVDTTPEIFDLDKELKKIDINRIEMKKGEVWGDENYRLMIGDSTIEADMLKLMDGKKTDMVMTDPPYILDYLKGKTKQKDGVTVGFGAKKNRRYLETESLPDNFTELWTTNVSKVQKEDFSIMIFEHPKKYLIDSLTVQRIFVMAIPMAIGTLFLFSQYVAYDIAKAMTVALTTLAAFQWFNAWNCRSETESIFRTNPFSNKYLIFGVLFGLVLMTVAVYVPFFQDLFDTVSLPAVWVFGVVGIGLFNILVVEIAKKIFRGKN